MNICLKLEKYAKEINNPNMINEMLLQYNKIYKTNYCYPSEIFKGNSKKIKDIIITNNLIVILDKESVTWYDHHCKKIKISFLYEPEKICVNENSIVLLVNNGTRLYIISNVHNNFKRDFYEIIDEDDLSYTINDNMQNSIVQKCNKCINQCKKYRNTKSARNKI